MSRRRVKSQEAKSPEISESIYKRVPKKKKKGGGAKGRKGKERKNSFARIRRRYGNFLM